MGPIGPEPIGPEPIGPGPIGPLGTEPIGPLGPASCGAIIEPGTIVAPLGPIGGSGGPPAGIELEERSAPAPSGCGPPSDGRDASTVGAICVGCISGSWTRGRSEDFTLARAAAAAAAAAGNGCASELLDMSPTQSPISATLSEPGCKVGAISSGFSSMRVRSPPSSRSDRIPVSPEGRAPPGNSGSLLSIGELLSVTTSPATVSPSTVGPPTLPSRRSLRGSSLGILLVSTSPPISPALMSIPARAPAAASSAALAALARAASLTALALPPPRSPSSDSAADSATRPSISSSHDTPVSTAMSRPEMSSRIRVECSSSSWVKWVSKKRPMSPAPEPLPRWCK